MATLGYTITGEGGDPVTPESCVLVAPVTLHVRETGWPAVMLLVDAVKLLMTGRAGPTVTVVVAVTLPDPLLAVSV